MKTTGLVVAMILAALPSLASAGTPENPEVRDVAGDANFVNSQGQSSIPDQNIQTSPASIDSADIVAIWLETLYSTVKDIDAEGRVLRVRHVPEALRVSIRTTAPVKPTFGPGVIFRVGTSMDSGCDAQLQLYLAGSAPGQSTYEKAELLRVRNCLGGNGAVPAEFPHAISGNVTTMTYPFDRSQGVLAPGITLGPFTTPPTTQPHSRVVLPNGNPGTTIPAIDHAPGLRPFVIGSDVPPDIDCAEDPGNPACS